MGDGPAPAAPRGWVALAFAGAALFASWNPIAAPFGLVVGVASAVLAMRALRRSSSRRLPAAALAVGILAAVASVAILLLTAGAVGVDLPGDSVLKTRSPQELEQVLGTAAERTRPQRERAARELERLTGERRDGGAAAPYPARDGGAGPADAGTRHGP